MLLSCRTAVHGSIVALLVASSVHAQGTEPVVNRWAITGAFDVGALPRDGFGASCFDNSTRNSPGAVGGGVGGFFRPRAGLILAADLRADVVPYGMGCKLIGRPPKQIGPSEFENSARRRFPSGAPGPGLVRTAFHVGKETPPGWPLLRAMVGAGVIWSGDATPFGSVAVSGSQSRSGMRVYWALDMSVARIGVHDEYTRYRVETGGVETSLPSRIEDFVLYPRWTMLRVGVEVPFTPR